MQTLILAVSVVIGLGALGIGAGALLLPELSSSGFGVKTSGSGNAYVRVSGARDIFIGLVFLYCFWRGDREALSMLSFFMALVSGSDFLITRAYGSKTKSYFHLVATLMVLSYAVVLRLK